MRFRWSPAPGMVRVNHKDLIGLLRGALRAAELEVETATVARDTALLDADARAHQLLQGRCHEVGVPVDPEVRDEVLAGLPMTADGRLHEAAFVALLDARVWAHREREVVAVMATGHFDVDGGDAR